MTLQQLRYFCEVVRCALNISKAAAALHISQPGLSRQMQLLEQELGVNLFVRNRTRLVRLSDAGTELVALADQTLAAAQSIRDAAREHAGDHVGSLTVATTHTQARYALPDVIRRFSQRYPAVQLSLRQGTPAEVSYLVASGHADISIATQPLDPPTDVVMLPCYELPRIVLTPVGHPLLRSKPLTLAGLASYPLITYDYTFIGRSRLSQAFEAQGLKPYIALNAIDADVIKTYVEFGLGVAIVPSLAFDPKRDRMLRAIDASHLFASNTIQIGIRRHHYLRSYTFAFIELFAPHLDRNTVQAAMAALPGRRPSRA